MTASFARARARGFQLGPTTPVQWEKRSRPTCLKGNRYATKFRRILSCVVRGTGLDNGEDAFSPVGPRDHGSGLAALSSLAVNISVLLQGVPASRRMGFKTATELRLFWGKSSHFVPFCPIHFCLFGPCETCLMSPTAECIRAWRIVRGGRGFEGTESPLGVGHRVELKRGGLRSTMALLSPAIRSQTVASPVPHVARPPFVCVRSLNPYGQRTRDEYTKRTRPFARRAQRASLRFWCGRQSGLGKRCDAEHRDEEKSETRPFARRAQRASLRLVRRRAAWGTLRRGASQRGERTLPFARRAQRASLRLVRRRAAWGTLRRGASQRGERELSPSHAGHSVRVFAWCAAERLGERCDAEHRNEENELSPSHAGHSVRVFAWCAAERLRERCDAEHRNEENELSPSHAGHSVRVFAWCAAERLGERCDAEHRNEENELSPSHAGHSVRVFAWCAAERHRERCDAEHRDEESRVAHR